MFDTGLSVSFIRRDVLNNIKDLGLPHKVLAIEERCQMVSGESCSVTQAIWLTISLHSFSWKIRFLIFEHCPVPCVLGVDFLERIRLRIDVTTGSYSFAFHPDRDFEFHPLDLCKSPSHAFQCCEETLHSSVCPCLSEGLGLPVEVSKLIQRFSALFSGKLGTAKGTVCHLEVIDNIPVWLRPYQCSPPRLKILREIIQDLFEKVVRRSSSQYASPAFLMPKPPQGGGV
jgi:hypothetical protein